MEHLREGEEELLEWPGWIRGKKAKEIRLFSWSINKKTIKASFSKKGRFTKVLVMVLWQKTSLWKLALLIEEYPCIDSKMNGKLERVIGEWKFSILNTNFSSLNGPQQEGLSHGFWEI